MSLSFKSKLAWLVLALVVGALGVALVYAASTIVDAQVTRDEQAKCQSAQELTGEIDYLRFEAGHGGETMLIMFTFTDGFLLHWLEMDALEWEASKLKKGLVKGNSITFTAVADFRNPGSARICEVISIGVPE